MKIKIIGLPGLLLAGLFLSGCATHSAISRVNQPDRSLIVVPVKGQPIALHSQHAASFLAAGVVGIAMERKATVSAAEALCARLNQLTNFDGERILAEECARLLKASPKVAFHEVTVAPQAAVLPGVKDNTASEQGRFKVLDPSKLSQWDNALSDWKKSSPVAGKPAPGQRVVFLEVTFHLVCLNHGDAIDPVRICLRLVDAETGAVLGFSDSFMGYSINEVTGTSDLRIFEADFRNCMNKCASKELHALNLL